MSEHAFKIEGAFVNREDVTFAGREDFGILGRTRARRAPYRCFICRNTILVVEEKIFTGDELFCFSVYGSIDINNIDGMRVFVLGIDRNDEFCFKTGNFALYSDRKSVV